MTMERNAAKAVFEERFAKVFDGLMALSQSATDAHNYQDANVALANAANLAFQARQLDTPQPQRRPRYQDEEEMA